MKGIKGFRKDIDKVDNKIKKLLIKRADIVSEIGKIKRQNNIEVIDENREKEVLERLTFGLNEIDGEYVKCVYQAIFSASRNRQK